MVKQFPHEQRFDNATAQCQANEVPTNLVARIADHARGTTSNDAKVKSRWAAGGFHKPGSNKK